MSGYTKFLSARLCVSLAVALGFAGAASVPASAQQIGSAYTDYDTSCAPIRPAARSRTTANGAARGSTAWRCG